MSEFLKLFPILVYRKEISENKTQFDSIQNEIKNKIDLGYEYKSSSGIGNSPYFSKDHEDKKSHAPTDSNIIESFRLHSFSNMIYQELNNFQENENPTIPVELKSSWFVKCYKNSSALLAHQHDSIYSFSYYYKVNSCSGGEIVFHPPLSIMSWLCRKTDNYSIKPKEGTLLIFPSILHHSINQFSNVNDSVSEDDPLRITLAGEFKFG
jgi:hypothetical protein